MNKTILSLISSILITSIGSSALAHAHLEKEYQLYWAKQHSATTEVILPDKARVDCLTREYAVEVDFSKKWAESIGQSLYYAIKTNRKPAVLLIMETPNDETIYLDRLNTVAKKYGIKVFTITRAELETR